VESINDKFKFPNVKSRAWKQRLNLLLVVCLLLSFALVGHSLFLARGLYDCSDSDCVICKAIHYVNIVAGQSAATAVTAFALLSALFSTAQFAPMGDSIWGNFNTPVSTKIRMNN